MTAEEFPLEDSKRLCVHLLEQAMAQLPSGSDTLLGIFDLRGFGNRNADLGFVRFLVCALPVSSLMLPLRLHPARVRQSIVRQRTAWQVRKAVWSTFHDDLGSTRQLERYKQ